MNARRLGQPPGLASAVYLACAFMLWPILGHKLTLGLIVALWACGCCAAIAMVCLPRDCTWADVRSWLVRTERRL